MIETLLTLLVYGTLILFNAYQIIGFHRACDYEEDDHGNITSKMIFSNFRLWCEKHLGEFWSKPVCTCVTCMASIHGSVVFWAFTIIQNQITPIAAIGWVLYILALSGLATKLND